MDSHQGAKRPVAECYHYYYSYGKNFGGGTCGLEPLEDSSRRLFCFEELSGPYVMEEAFHQPQHIKEPGVATLDRDL